MKGPGISTVSAGHPETERTADHHREDGRELATTQSAAHTHPCLDELLSRDSEGRVERGGVPGTSPTTSPIPLEEILSSKSSPFPAGLYLPTPLSYAPFPFFHLQRFIFISEGPVQPLSG